MITPRRNLVLSAFGALLLLLLAACEADRVPATQVLVTVDSDLTLGGDVDRVQVEVRNRQGMRTSPRHTFVLAEPEDGEETVRFPFSFGVEKRTEDRFELIVTGLRDNREMVEYRVNAAFEAEKTLGLSVFLATACLDAECDDGETCYGRPRDGVAAGECGEIRGDSLDAVDPDDAPRAGSGGRGGSGGSGRGGSGAAGRGGAGAAGAGGGGRGGSGGAAAGSGGAGAPAAGSGGAGGSAAGSGGAGSAGSGTCPAGETTYYLDADDDGFGDSDRAMTVCGPAPSGYVSSGADCCDEDDRAFPGQELGFDVPSYCSDNGYDYNCDGLEEYGNPYLADGQCCTESEQEGWLIEVPDCGESGTLNGCDESCLSVTVDIAQPCR